MSYLLRDEYESADRWVRWGRRIGVGLIGAVAGAGVLTVCLWVYAQMQLETQLRSDLLQVIQVLNYNLQNGTLKLPPPPTPPPAPAPTPPPTPPTSK